MKYITEVFTETEGGGKRWLPSRTFTNPLTANQVCESLKREGLRARVTEVKEPKRMPRKKPDQLRMFEDYWAPEGKKKGKKGNDGGGHP